MQSSIKSSQLKKGWGSVTASGAVEGGGDGEVVLTLAEKDREAEEEQRIDGRCGLGHGLEVVQKFQ